MVRIAIYSHLVNSHFVNSHLVSFTSSILTLSTSHFVNFPLCQLPTLSTSHFVNSHYVNIDDVRIDKVKLTKWELTKWDMTKWEDTCVAICIVCTFCIKKIVVGGASHSKTKFGKTLISYIFNHSLYMQVQSAITYSNLNVDVCCLQCGIC